MDIGNWQIRRSVMMENDFIIDDFPRISNRKLPPPPLDISPDQSSLSTEDVEQQFSPLYPHNQSLAEELARLFVTSIPDPESPHSTDSPGSDDGEDFMDDFRHNGRDFEYCPELDPSGKLVSFNNRFQFCRRRNNKRPLAQECVFCKNNGEEDTFYKGHILKDRNGRVTCPILRNYTCPICQTTGDFAHTIKYCPDNKNQEAITSGTAIKYGGRSSAGKVRKPAEFFANATKSFRNALIQNAAIVRYGPPQSLPAAFPNSTPKAPCSV